MIRCGVVWDEAIRSRHNGLVENFRRVGLDKPSKKSYQPVTVRNGSPITE